MKDQPERFGHITTKNDVYRWNIFSEKVRSMKPEVLQRDKSVCSVIYQSSQASLWLKVESRRCIFRFLHFIVFTYILRVFCLLIRPEMYFLINKCIRAMSCVMNTYLCTTLTVSRNITHTCRAKCIINTKITAEKVRGPVAPIK